MYVNVKALRRLNTTHNRTDVENLFLKEMMLEDQDSIINESDDLAIDTIVSDEIGDNGSLFGDSSSEDLDDILYDEDECGEFSMVDL
jgi:hypothetical protein